MGGGPSSVYAYSSVASLKCGVLMENEDNQGSLESHATEEKEVMINDDVDDEESTLRKHILNNHTLQEVSVMNGIFDDMNGDDFDDEASSVHDDDDGTSEPEESLLDCFKETNE